MINPLDYAGDPFELELQHELKRLGIENEPMPEACTECGHELECGSGFAGETLLYCPEGHGIQWSDCEGAIRNVL